MCCYCAKHCSLMVFAVSYTRWKETNNKRKRRDGIRDDSQKPFSNDNCVHRVHEIRQSKEGKQRKWATGPHERLSRTEYKEHNQPLCAWLFMNAQLDLSLQSVLTLRFYFEFCRWAAPSIDRLNIDSCEVKNKASGEGAPAEPRACRWAHRGPGYFSSCRSVSAGKLWSVATA